MALTGFDPSIVSTAIDNVNSAYEAVLTALGDTNKNTFVVPMSSIWGSPQAKTFFTDYKNAISAMSVEVTKVFKSVVDSMSSAANSLASIAGASWSVKELSGVTKELDISCIKENIEGVIGIDYQQAINLLPALNGVSNAVIEGLNEARSAVANSGFVGGDMQASLLHSLGTISTNISSQFNALKDKAAEAISETISTYKTTTGDISTNFSGGAN